MADNRPDKKELMHHINVISFAVDDVSLFLNTHPDDCRARQSFEKWNSERQQALHEYADNFGPLTLDSACSDADCWSWINDPWPWQKGGC